MATFFDQWSIYFVIDGHTNSGGVVLVQNLLISGIVGCFAAATQDLAEKRLGHKIKPIWIAIVYLPFLLPPVLMHTQQPFRTTWSAWTELFLVFIIVAVYLRGETLSKKELCAIVIIGTLAASWRSECVYYLVAIPVMLSVLCFRKQLSLVAWGIVTVLICCGYFVCSSYSNALMGEAWQYRRIALCYQAAALVQDADPIDDAADLAAIDKIFDVNFCRNNTQMHGNDLRMAIMREDEENGPTATDWKACQAAIIHLAVKYPKSLLRERLGMFYNTVRQRQNGQSNQKVVFASAFLLYKDEPERADQKEFLQENVAVEPINRQLRENFIIAMACSSDFAGGLIDLTWRMLPSFALLFAACLVLLVQRRWMLLFAAGTFFVKIPLVFLTAPDTYFLYYLTPFIAGYAIGASALLWLVIKHKQKRGRKAA